MSIGRAPVVASIQCFIESLVCAGALGGLNHYTLELVVPNRVYEQLFDELSHLPRHRAAGRAYGDNLCINAGGCSVLVRLASRSDQTPLTR